MDRVLHGTEVGLWIEFYTAPGGYIDGDFDFLKYFFMQ